MSSFRLVIVCLFICLVQLGQSQTFKIFVFHKTNGFRHTNAINEGLKMFRTLGVSNGWEVYDSQNAADFNTQNLSEFKVVVWHNTSGNDLLTETQKQAFELFIKSGGGFVGVHAATDTYRNKSWLWYNKLVGAIVQTNPNHSANNTEATMDVLDKNHEIVNHLGSTWTKKEEWFYWDLNGGTYYDINNVLLKVRETGSKSYDRSRPVVWYKEYDGGRSFYSALGHNGSDYIANSSFGKMMAKAIIWASSTNSTSIIEAPINQHISVFPNPALPQNTIVIKGINNKSLVIVYALSGKTVFESKAENNSIVIPSNVLPKGIYVVKIYESNNSFSTKLIVN
jgi:uncharacterized protein